MRTFGKGGIFFCALALFIALLLVLLAVFSCHAQAVAVISYGKEYYFLARRCARETSAAVAGDSYLAGGAGYLYEEGGESYAVLAGYYSASDAEFVGSLLKGRGVDVTILTLSCKEFELSLGHGMGKNHVVSNLSTAESCARMCFDAANGLEQNSLTQEEARAATNGIAASLSGLAEGNAAEGFGLWNVLLRRTARRARELATGILFAKDLRYLQVTLLMAIVSAHKYFA